jgi:hypothetical protein
MPAKLTVSPSNPHDPVKDPQLYFSVKFGLEAGVRKHCLKDLIHKIQEIRNFLRS